MTDARGRSSIPLDVAIREEAVAQLHDQADIPIGFQVHRILDVVDAGLGGITLRERVLDSPYWKDYDAIEGEEPSSWADRFDVSNWGLVGAYADGVRVGGVVIAFKALGLDLLDGRSDVAVVWDLRVVPEWRRRGVGARLWGAAELWAGERGCRLLEVETQNVNVGACRFYARQGCVLGAVDRFAYPRLPEEVQLLWCKDLRREALG